MRVILHIGQSKTGTTSLQSFLASNRTPMVKAGICYPDVYRSGIPLSVQNHNSFAESLCGFRRFPGFSAEEYWSQFQDQARKAGCHTLLLSGESFFGAPQIWRLPEGDDYLECYAQKLNKLKNLLGKDDCHVYIYLRRQDEWVDSAIPQIIRYEGLLNRSVYESDVQIIDMLAPHLDYVTLLDLWKKLIEPSEMTVIPFERDHLTAGDTVADFIRRIKITDSIPLIQSQETREHTSLSREFIMLKKILNRTPKSKTEERTIISILTDLDKKIGSRKQYKIDTALRVELMNRVADQNRSLAQKYDGTGPEFFSDFAESKVMPSDANSNGVSLEDGMAALMAFENTYILFATSLKRCRMASAAFLRLQCPPLHALARRIFLLFRS